MKITKKQAENIAHTICDNFIKKTDIGKRFFIVDGKFINDGSMLFVSSYLEALMVYKTLGVCIVYDEMNAADGFIVLTKQKYKG
jgi:hypothetical protein